jgi:hypothetical protein
MARGGNYENRAPEEYENEINKQALPTTQRKNWRGMRKNEEKYAKKERKKGG